ncbi:hypothetical protein A2U01_0109781, partial [Trifolium medium]|nr:hypothetical protein [Trifolium medium]
RVTLTINDIFPSSLSPPLTTAFDDSSGADKSGNRVSINRRSASREPDSKSDFIGT